MGVIGDLPQAMAQVAHSLEQLIRMLWPLAHPLEPVAVLISDGIGLLLTLWFKLLRRTTDVETGQDFVGSAAIKSFEPSVQLVADSLLGLVVVWASYKVMWGHSASSKYSVRVLLPRLFLAAVLINFSQPMFQGAVTASNTLSHVFALAALLVVFKVPGAMGSAENVAHKLESLLHHSVSQVEHAVLRTA